MFSKEKEQTEYETPEKALNQFLDNIRSKPLNPATQIFISGELNRVFSNRDKVANIQKENPNLMDEYFSDPIFQQDMVLQHVVTFYILIVKKQFMHLPIGEIKNV